MGADKQLKEIAALKQRIRELEHLTAQHGQAKESLRESEERYRFLTEKMSDIAWIMDMNLKTIYVSPSIEKVLGFTSEERKRQDVQQQLTPASLSFVFDKMERELALEKQGRANPERTLTVNLEFYHKDGSTRWLETLITGLRDKQGQLTGLHGVSRDITERRVVEEALRKNEKQHRMMLEKMPVAVFVYLKGKIVFVNQAFLTLFKLTSHEQIIDQYLIKYIPAEMYDTVEKVKQGLKEGKSDIPSVEANVRGGDGEVLFISNSVMPIVFDGQQAVLVVISNVTEFKLKVIELEKCHKLLQIQAKEIETLKKRLKSQKTSLS